MDDSQLPSGPDLRTVLARLRELERKCRTMATRSGELAEHQERIERILEVLERAPRDATTSYRPLARQLAPVAAEFERLGFATVAREVRYVATSLEAFDAGPSGSDDDAEPATTRPGPSPPEIEAPEPVHGDGPGLDWRARLRPTPAITVLTILLGVACIAAWLFVRAELARLDAPSSASRPAPTPTPPPPRVTPTAAAPTAPVVVRSALPEAISAARLALEAGELDTAVEHLSDAARVDPRHGLVLDTAEAVVAALVARSDTFADRSRWEEAEERLERARRIALRFDLDAAAVEAASRRHAAMPRIEIVQPTDRAGLARLVGRQVEIRMRSGQPVDGWILAVDDERIQLRRARQVAGGTVFYQDQVSLSAVAEVHAAPVP